MGARGEREHKEVIEVPFLKSPNKSVTRVGNKGKRFVWWQRACPARDCNPAATPGTATAPRTARRGPGAGSLRSIAALL